VTAATTALVASSVAAAGSASAAVPTGWAPDEGMSVTLLLAVILFVPVACAIVISLAVLLPGVLRGEGLIPKPPVAEPGDEIERY